MPRQFLSSAGEQQHLRVLSLLAAGLGVFLIAAAAGGHRNEGAPLRWLFVPVPHQERERLPEVSRFTVHLVPESRKDEEIVRPAGEQVLIENKEERYRVWLEALGFISPRQWILVDAAGTVAEGHVKTVRLPVTKAGSVQLSFVPEGQVSLRILHLASGFVRRVRGEALGTPVQVPPGVIVGAFWHETTGRYLAVSKPVATGPGSPAILTPRAPDPPFSDLMAVLAPAERSQRLLETKLALRTPDGVVREPGACGGDDSALYCFWYDLRARWAVLEVSNNEGFVPQTQVALPAGHLVVAEISAKVPPSLRVLLRLPPELQQERKVEVMVGAQVVRSETLAPHGSEVFFPEVPDSPLTVSLTVGDWTFLEHLEPEPARENQVVFEPPVFRVHGTVFVGDEPTPATVRFFTGAPQKWVEVVTDDDGQYEVSLFASSPWAQVAIKGLPQPVLLRVDTPFRPDTLLDLRLPGKALEVTVLGGAVGVPLAEAEVAVLGAVVEEQGPVFRLQGTTDQRGQVRFGPLSGEQVSVAARARGFREQKREVKLLPEGTTKLVFRLESETHGKLVRMVRPSGEPAAGAQAWVLPSALAEVVVWEGKADNGGELRVPADLCCLLAVTDPQGGLTTVAWPGEGDETTVVLRRRAAPLTVRAQRGDGAPAPFARLRLWIDGHPVGPALVFHGLGTHLYFDHQGFWQASGLPEGPVAMVSWEPEASTLGQAGAFDSQRQTIPYPWPPAVVVQPFR